MSCIEFLQEFLHFFFDNFKQKSVARWTSDDDNNTCLRVFNLI